jgi:nitrogen fixation NifU-like protein
MSDGLDQLEDEIMAEMRKVFSETAIDHAMNPRNVGSMPDADANASVLGPCGDSMEIWLKIRGDKVIEATFWTDGCGSSIACGSMATELARGKTVREALAISAEVIVRNLGGLPSDSLHCAGLASSTLKKALIEYMNLQKEPWKKAYHKH